MMRVIVIPISMTILTCVSILFLMHWMPVVSEFIMKKMLEWIPLR